MGDSVKVNSDARPNIDQLPQEFNHRDDLIFWQSIHPQQDQVPTVEDTKTFFYIRKEIEDRFPATPNLTKCIKFLRRCFGIELNHEDVPVKVRKFVQMTKWFGPFKTTENSCIFLEQINHLSSYTLNQDNKKVSPFAGMISQENAEALLIDCKVESFLVRFSEGLADRGGFSLAVKANDCEVRHYNILGDPQSAASGDPYNAHLKLIHRIYEAENEMEQEYRNIVDFMDNRLDDYLEDNIGCTYICPDLPFNALFRGYD